MLEKSLKNLVSIILLLCLVSEAHTDSSVWQITDTYSIPLTQTARDRLQTEYFSLGQWSVATAITDLYHDVWRYPTVNDVNSAGVFVIYANMIGLGDFNNDGRQDLLMNWTVFPHVLDRPPIAPSFFMNEDGLLKLHTNSWIGDPAERKFAFKVGVADFNLDGVDDVVMSSMGIATRLPDGKFDINWERISLLMSQSQGFVDFSAQIEGQESGVIKGFSFAHDIAVGDVNGDGFPDFYQGRHLFIGDGRGVFSLRNDLIPKEAGPGFRAVMSSAMGDLDNDGVDDLVIALMEPAMGIPGKADPEVDKSGWIFLSNGSPNLANAKMVPLPAGLYGLENSKHNSMKLADLNGKGRLDIVIGQTKAEPYYRGRQLQVLINQGDGVFTDESAARVSDSIHPNAQGAGTVFVMDVNGDGYPDIVDKTTDGHLAILINDGAGFFEIMPMSLLPLVQNHHLQEFEQFEGREWYTDDAGQLFKNVTNTLHIYPIDLHGDGVVSFLVQIVLPRPVNIQIRPGDFFRSVLYTITPKKPYKPVPGARMLSDQECLFQWAESIEPQLLPDRGVVTSRQGAVNYRYYGSTDTYLGFRANRVLLYRPAESDQIVDLGGLYEFLPHARAARCN
jgi:hypothetical protein